MLSGDDTGFTPAVALLFAVSALVVVSGVAIGVVASSASGGVFTAGDTGKSETIQQQDPQEVGSESSLSAVQRQLAERAARRIQSGAVNISRGQYDSVRRSLNDSQYGELLDRYREVADETGNADTSRAFLQMRKNQREYAVAAERYQRLYRLYNGSVRLSNSEERRLVRQLPFVNSNQLRDESVRYVSGPLPAYRADSNRTLGTVQTDPSFWNRSQRRQFAHRLGDRWRRVDERGTALVRNYRQLENITDREYTAAIDSVRADRRNVSDRQKRVRQTVLVPVELTATAPDPRGSFVDPIRITGRLATPNGTAIGNESVRLAVNNQTYRTRTDTGGNYAIDYRPTTISANASEVAVQFRPSPVSPYAWASENASVEVVRARPNVTVGTRSLSSASAAERGYGYNETLVVEGWVGAGDAGATNVSYLVTIDGQLVAQNRTRSNGTFRTDVSLPATIPTGTRDVRVALVTRGSALASVNESAPIRVVSTPTNLSVTATQSRESQRTIRLDGRFGLPDGGGVPAQDLRVVVNGSFAGTITTGSGGQFSSTVVLPESVGGGVLDRETKLDVRVVYGGQGTNLDRASGGAVTTIRSGIPLVWVFVLVGVLTVAGIGYLLVRGLRRRGTSPEGPSDVDGFGGGSYVPGSGDEAADASLLDRARGLLADGESALALQYGYAALRRRLEREYGLGPTRTPREFYRECQREDIDADVVETVERLTELYERTVFASDAVSSDVSQTAIDRVDSHRTDGD